MWSEVKIDIFFKLDLFCSRRLSHSQDGAKEGLQIDCEGSRSGFQLARPLF